MQLTVLTQTSLATFRRCPRQYYYRYELGLIRERTAKPLRFGTAFHAGLESGDIEKPASLYDDIPAWANSHDWNTERETLRSLLAGHFWRYQGIDAEIIHAEICWEVPLKNPESGRRSRRYMLAGKIDKIIRLDDGRLAVMEHKTAGEDIGDASDYWPRLRYDAQISAYVYAARERGHDVQTVIYDVTRKPEIAPKLIPVLDSNGCKIVEDAAGERIYNKNGKPRESASTADGWTVRSERETPEVFGARLLEDIGERPELYYARREIPRLQRDLDEFAAECWMQSQQLDQAKKNASWYRSVSAMNCRNCSYKDICLGGIEVNFSSLPPGYVITSEIHGELSGESL